MSVTFYAQDNEFAASTGSNVNYSFGFSRFDHPPTSSKDLKIISRAGDNDPRRFEVGGTYTVSFSGNRGATVTNATVIRSDYMTADDGTPVERYSGAIVFEGQNENGDLIQVFWSPNFDLEAWYSKIASGPGNLGTTPGFHTEDNGASDAAHFACFTAGTWIKIPGGQCRVEELKPGNLVETLDNGPIELLWCANTVAPGLGCNAPITIAPELLGGHTPLTVSPQHRMLVRHPRFDLIFDTPEVLISSKHLASGDRVKAKSNCEVSYHQLLFDRHEIIFANGMEAESLLLGDQAQGDMPSDVVNRLADDAKADGIDLRASRAARPIVKAAEASLVKQALGLHFQNTTHSIPKMLFAA